MQHARNVREPGRLGHERGIAEALEPADVGGGVAALPRQDEIGPEGDDALEIHARGIPDFGDPARGRREIAEARDADEPPARARRESELGQTWRKRDHALRGGGEPHRPAAIIFDGYRLRMRRARGEQATEERRRPHIMMPRSMCCSRRALVWRRRDDSIDTSFTSTFEPRLG